MNQQNQTTAPKTFTTIDGNSLMAQEYEPLQFAIEKILPHGIFIFAGSPKVGKSWLTLESTIVALGDGRLCKNLSLLYNIFNIWYNNPISLTRHINQIKRSKREIKCQHTKVEKIVGKL